MNVISEVIKVDAQSAEDPEFQMLIIVKNVLKWKKMYLFLIFCIYVLQRDGCPKIINLGSAKTDLFYERKKYGFKKR